MRDEPEILTTLAAFADVLRTQHTLGGALATIAEACTTSVPRCDAASIALSVNGRPTTAAATARIALELDLVQYDLHDGPCLTSFRTMANVRLDLVEPFEDFPHFAIASRDKGMTGVLSVPARWGDDRVGTLNLYSRTGTFDETAATVGTVLAAQVSLAVSRSPEFAAARSVVEHAQRDADDHAGVDLATGLLMANQGCTPNQAAGLLRQAAVEGDTSILQIAHRIIDQHHHSR